MCARSTWAAIYLVHTLGGLSHVQWSFGEDARSKNDRLSVQGQRKQEPEHYRQAKKTGFATREKDAQAPLVARTE